MKPKSYRHQKCCANCMYVFVRQNYDDLDYFFCALDAPPRPLCGSLFMNESFFGRQPGKTFFNEAETPEFQAMETAWENWKADRDVEAFGICEEWKPATEIEGETFFDSPAFMLALRHDDGQAAKDHLAAGRSIYYGDDRYPGEIIRENPDGTRQIVVVRGKGKIEVVRDIESKK